MADDVRIRSVVGSYRCVAPAARQVGTVVYLNGALVIEKLSQNALGEPTWSEVHRICKPLKGETAEIDDVLYYLLGGSEH